jgi:hypothetical protein
MARGKFIKVRVEDQQLLDWHRASAMAGMTLSDAMRQGVVQVLSQQLHALTAPPQPAPHAPGLQQET